MPHRPAQIDFPELHDAVREARACADGPQRKGSWLNIGAPGHAVWRRTDLAIRGLNPSLDGVRIVHLTDLHMRGRWHRAYDRLLDEISENPPDLLLFTGDFVECKYDHRPALPYLRRFIKGLAAKHGIFAILGNHDSDVVQAHVAELGVRVLTHRRVVAKVADGEVEIIGLPGLARADLDLGFLRGHPLPMRGVPRIVLSHYPDYLAAARNLEMDVFLAGHTHGGQMCLPDGTAGITHDSLPKVLGKGVHRVGRTWLVVSNGLGFSGLMVRMFCPSEVGEFTLRGSEA